MLETNEYYTVAVYFIVHVLYNTAIGLITTTRHGEVNDWYRRMVIEPTAFKWYNKALGSCEQCFAFWVSIIASIVTLTVLQMPFWCMGLLPLFSLSKFKK